mmetsp:Transcript_51680/g.123024  ORF Transcript_51680/g.123024 Transcript_51680/m.123024 type:complete len:264 (+) Transcript_51680:51-842(+)
MDAGEAQPINVAYDASALNGSIWRDFVRKVYGLVAGQLVLSAATAALVAAASGDGQDDGRWLLLALFVGAVPGVFLGYKGEQVFHSFPCNIGTLGLLTACQAILVGCIRANVKFTLIFCLASAGMSMLVLSVIAACTQVDNVSWKGQLVSASLGLIGFSIGALLQGHDIKEVVLGFVIGLVFSGHVIYDMQLILSKQHRHGFGVDDYVLAALAVYLDAMRFFQEPIGHLFLWLKRLYTSPSCRRRRRRYCCRCCRPPPDPNEP